MASEKYNDPSMTLERLQSINIKLNELVAQSQSLTMTEITNSIKNTKIQRKYKNVHILVQKLRSSNLIEEEVNVKRTRRRHNEKYFRLTDNGIYQLFLNLRYHGILVDQMSVRQGKEPVSHVNNFMKNYENSAVFELFLYPYFEKQTISTADVYLLTKLFKFVHDCCRHADLAEKIPYMIPQFSWNKVPGENDKELLTSLKEVFRIEYLDNTKIEKTPDESTIRITTSEIDIIIKLEREKGKAIATTDFDGKPRRYEYKMLDLFSELTAFKTVASNNEFVIKRLAEIAICVLVTEIGRESAHLQEKNIHRILAEDTKFMTVLEEIHKDFEDGYNKLMALRKNT